MRTQNEIIAWYLRTKVASSRVGGWVTFSDHTVTSYSVAITEQIIAGCYLYVLYKKIFKK